LFRSEEAAMGIMYGDYEILEELPSWTSGVVYRARHRNTGQMGAVKMMDMTDVDEKEKEKFYKTAARAAGLRHRNIARILDVCSRVDVSMMGGKAGERREIAYIVQEFVPGTSLDKVLRDQGTPFMPQLAFFLVDQVVEALKYGHAQGIPHCNLTMSNIILKRDGQVKLVDYGIGRLFSSGTIFYMSPEDIAGEDVSEKAEIFTVGILLFEMLMGVRPFDGENFGQLMNNILACSYNEALMKEIPPFIRRIVESCLRKDPAERYESLDALLEDIKECQRSPDLFAFNAPLGTVEKEQAPPETEDLEKEMEGVEAAVPGEETAVETPSGGEAMEAGDAEAAAFFGAPEEAAEETPPAPPGEVTAGVGAEGEEAGAANEEDLSDVITEDLRRMEQEDFPVTTRTVRVEEEEKKSEEPEAAPAPAFDNPFLQAIAEVPMFRGLDRESIVKFSRVLKTRSFTDGARIITQGQPGEYLFVILDGEVSVIQEDGDGNEIELTTLREGDCFGEMSLLTGESCSATIRSKGPSTLLSLYKDDFQMMLAEYPSVSVHFNKILIQRLRNTNLKFETEIEQGVSGRLSTISLTDLIQTIFLGQKTGKLLLSRRHEEGFIYFSGGKIRAVTAGELAGERAFYFLLEWEDGTFRFVQGEEEMEENISTDTNALLMEGMRRLDECRKLIEYIGSTKRIFYIEREILENIDALELSENAKRIAPLFNGMDTVDEVIAKTNAFKLEALESIIELYTKDLLLEV